MNKFEDIVENMFESIIKSHNMTFIPMNGSQVFLVGQGFALSICVSIEGADINYIVRTEKNGPEIYYISNFLLLHRFTADDSACYGKPTTNEERILAELRVFASGLMNRCTDILSGDKVWLQKLQGKGMNANQSVASILEPIFNKQII